MSYNPKTHVVSPNPEWLVCEGLTCHRTAPDGVCGKCRRSYYCSTTCQKSAWPTHKANCVDCDEKARSLGTKMTILNDLAENKLCLVCERTSKALVFLDCSHAICLECSVKYKETKCNECGTVFDAASSPESYLMTRFIQQLDSAELAAAEILKKSARIDENKVEDDLLYDAKHAVKKSLDAYKLLEQLLRSSQPGTLLNGLVNGIRTEPLRLAHMARFSLLAGNAQECISSMESALSVSVTELKVNLGRLLARREISNDKYNAVVRQINQDGRAALYKIFSTMLVDYPSRHEIIKSLLKSYFAMGQAYEMLQKPAEALDWYGRIPSKDKDHLAVCAEGLVARSRVQHQRGNTAVALNLAKEALNADDSLPGIHAVLSNQQKQLGDLTGAKATMNKALFCEAPWDKTNKYANKMLVKGIYEEERRIEEERVREEHFLELWGEVIEEAKLSKQSDEFVSWESVKLKRFDMFAELEEDEDRQLIDKQLGAAAMNAALGRCDEDAAKLLTISRLPAEVIGSEMVGESTETTTRRLDEVERPDFDRIKLTKQVTKWLGGSGRGSDAKLRNIFLQRMRQLAAGDRSRILNKRLSGARNMTIYETYMDGNFRILWTEDCDSDEIDLGLVIWFVSPHDNVSRCMKKIDEAVTRSSRQMITTTTASSLPDFADDGDDENDLAPSNVLLDPESDIPLKLYVVHYDDISRLGHSWQPPLYLTAEERHIVETKGTVLLLGRSGTGKTVCKCNRIDFDRHLAENDPTFTALFVARSKRICNYVQESVGQLTDDTRSPSSINFSTFGNLLKRCEERLFRPGELYPDDQRMTFPHFKTVFGEIDCRYMDALVVWTSIKSFIKGSIEAVMKGRPLSREEYLDTKIIGSRRCRLSAEQRERVYCVFETYQAYMVRQGTRRWDDCDRMARVIEGLREDRGARDDLSHQRVYVDEIQDYTQAEIALFFLICSRSGLFLAGDPAQSVVEGVEFRFEEVRSVAWNLFDEIDRPKYVPSKPLTVNRNFRSHKGILNVAGEILDRLFQTFPGSAKELPKDEGLFKGPRPSVLLNVKPSILKDLVNKIEGVVLLTMTDEKVTELESLVGSGVVVLSIRDSKGLEFSDVLIVDFFDSLPAEHQKPWKMLIQGKVEDKLASGFPELETHLKQLYTGVTRCTNHLFFAETGNCEAGQAFFRRLTQQLDLATTQNVKSVEGLEKSPDEWRALGVKYAIYGEDEKGASAERGPIYWMTKARAHFNQSHDQALISKADLHLESIEFRLMDDAAYGAEGVSIEMQTVSLLLRLVQQGLTLEARRVYNRVHHLFDEYTRVHLEKRFAVLLPELDD